MKPKGHISRSLLLEIEIFESASVRGLNESCWMGSLGDNLLWDCLWGPMVKYRGQCYSKHNFVGSA